jgi:hypothetical protein
MIATSELDIELGMRTSARSRSKYCLSCIMDTYDLGFQ